MKTALITGVSSGIGLELAHIFASNNINVILVARSEKTLNELAETLVKKYGIKAQVFVKDLTIEANVKSLFDELANQQIDYLVNNAGFGTFAPFSETKWETSAQMIALNITTLTYLTRLFLPQMIANKSGKILNIASVAAFLPGPYMAVYYATKAYVLHFSEAIAQELKNTGVTVTTLCPGPTESQFMDVSGMAESKLIKGKKLPTSNQVAEYGYDAMMRGQHVAVHGLANYILSLLPRFFPRRITSWMVGLIQKK